MPKQMPFPIWHITKYLIVKTIGSKPSLNQNTLVRLWHPYYTTPWRTISDKHHREKPRYWKAYES